MQIVRSGEHARGFRLGTWDLERLVQLLGGDERVTRVAVDLSDGAVVGLAHAGEIPALPNPPGRSIVGITLESAPPPFLASPDEPPRVALVRLRDRAWGAIAWHVSGDDRAVERLTRELEDWCASVTPWYGGLATASRIALAFHSLLLLGLLALLLLAAGIATGAGPGLPAMSGVPSLALAARAAAGGAFVLLAGALLAGNLRRDRLFPVAQFLVGDGGGRERRLARRRRWLLGTSGIAGGLVIAGSVLSGLGG